MTKTTNGPVRCGVSTSENVQQVEENIMNLEIQ